MRSPSGVKNWSWDTLLHRPAQRISIVPGPAGWGEDEKVGRAAGDALRRRSPLLAPPPPRLQPLEDLASVRPLAREPVAVPRLGRDRAIDRLDRFDLFAVRESAAAVAPDRRGLQVDPTAVLELVIVPRRIGEPLHAALGQVPDLVHGGHPAIVHRRPGRRRVGGSPARVTTALARTRPPSQPDRPRARRKTAPFSRASPPPPPPPSPRRPSPPPPAGARWRQPRRRSGRPASTTEARRARRGTVWITRVRTGAGKALDTVRNDRATSLPRGFPAAGAE